MPLASDTASLFINGEWTAASDGGSRELTNPANGEVFAKVAEGTAEDAERAIRAARSGVFRLPVFAQTVKACADQRADLRL